ncbi:hypothetical protein PPTG_06822 [Phytophthora nicotianae INRA-310]|uniref:Uncharacterized protein n=1 Tax=Phytophthora nicotianae (strain INRA-310) TaxID=761204 RepID=W2QSV7_PHYN3|nr:hypothetical protein PPTG_06822 [Phytophthora nicotianae INRA-310]ETN15579.1 hypothetical protein PPTG_06822 [Phytophthora nicotianae INRA-310]
MFTVGKILGTLCSDHHNAVQASCILEHLKIYKTTFTLEVFETESHLASFEFDQSVPHHDDECRDNRGVYLVSVLSEMMTMRMVMMEADCVCAFCILTAIRDIPSIRRSLEKASGAGDTVTRESLFGITIGWQGVRQQRLLTGRRVIH